jgi:hypothetical protein
MHGIQEFRQEEDVRSLGIQLPWRLCRNVIPRREPRNLESTNVFISTFGFHLGVASSNEIRMQPSPIHRGKMPLPQGK